MRGIDIGGVNGYPCCCTRSNGRSSSTQLAHSVWQGRVWRVEYLVGVVIRGAGGRALRMAGAIRAESKVHAE